MPQTQVTMETSWTATPEPWISGTTMDWVLEDDAEDVGIYHVTPYTTQVLHSGRLKPRREVRHRALGGGYANVSPDLVSVTVTRNQAELLAHGIRTMALAARNLIAPHLALVELLKWVTMEWDYMEECDQRNPEAEGELVQELQDLERLMFLQVTPDPDPYSWIRRVLSDAGTIDRAVFRESVSADPGEATYRWLCDIESKLGRVQEDTIGTVDADLTNSPIIGFTSPWERFVRANPDDISIVRLAARVSATADLVPNEQELRFCPSDLRIIECQPV